MTIRKVAPLAAAVLILCSAVGAGRAQDKPAAGAGRLTDASLEAMLKNLGHTPTATKSESGKRTYYRLDLSEDSFTFVVDLSLDPEGARLWFSAPLVKVPERDRVALDRLWKLLESNDDILPASFSYDASRQRFYLNLTVDNRDITPAVLRKELSTFTRTIEKTYPLWKEVQPPSSQDGKK